ncbi:hypothetical protein EB796_013261 [Bugula neritina]|uniref:Uncharacterized protein n=1 Tax=Bugula neritina TaxID=10212 RepID=A0A7J7JPZ8_BUGNE|nr:hypothetical protein EB796_013261 [Bugula neritina]
MSDDYNLRHRVKCATLFAIGQDVHLRAEESQQPASGANLDPPPNVTPSDAMKDVPEYRTRSGRLINKPVRLDL